MPRYKNYLELDEETDKNYYRICHELETHGKSIIEDIDKKEWWNDLRIQIGRDAKRLNNITDEKLMYPPVTNRRHRFGIVSVPNNVKVIKKQLRKKSRFSFTR